MIKRILITGSTDGIGKETALLLAKQGHNIYLHGRNSTKLSQTILEVKSAGANIVKGFQADFSDMSSVRNMAAEVSSLEHLDVLINNAGVLLGKNTDRFDLRFKVNYLAPYLLTTLILPLLQSSQFPRIINLSSAAQSTVSLDALLGSTSISENAAYAESKLALTMWTTYFAKMYENITTIAVNPGSLLNTKMVHEAYNQVWSSISKGSSLLADLAILDEFKTSSGLYFDNDLGDIRGKFTEAHQDAYNTQKINALITTTQSILQDYL